jgi:carbamoyltransferase
MSNILRQFRTYHEIYGIWHLPNIKVLYPSVDKGKSNSWYIRTNSIGIRDEREFSYKVKPAFNRILLFGDSYTFASGVDVEKGYSFLLEKALNNFEIMNFGIGSTGIDQYYLIYKNLGIKYDADILMINPYLNNVARSTKSDMFYKDRDGNIIKLPKPYFIIENNELVLKNMPVPKNKSKNGEFCKNERKNYIFQQLFGGEPYSFKNRAIKKYFINTNYKYWFVKLFPIQPYPEYLSSDHPHWILSKRILMEFIKTSKQKKILIAPLPSWTIIMNPRLAKYRERFLELNTPEKGVYVIDVLPYFLKLKYRDRIKCFNSKRDHHYSEIGHKIVAKALFNEMMNNHIINQ